MARTVLVIVVFAGSILAALEAVLADGPGTSASHGQSTVAAVDSFATERDSLMQSVLKSIAGREEEPAEKVFKNIQILKGVPAGRLPRIMNQGYGRSLGVGCRHCHNADQWDSDEKDKKKVTREMAQLVRTLNQELLPKIAHLESEKPTVNCTTCHRGQRKPALNL